MFKTKNNPTGFTLIELLVVIAIIGFLATTAFVAYSTVKQKGRDTKRNADTATIAKALDLYQARNERYPVSTGACITGNDAVSTALIKDLPAIPKDPLTRTDADATPASGVKPHCYYYTSEDGSAYTLEYYLEGEKATKTRVP